MSANSQPLIATIYNPHNQSKEALIAGFIARKQKFERLFRDIRDAPMTKPEQHYLIQGIRGMGKTTLLLRIAYEIDNTPELRERLIPIVFNEEEYGIGSLADVWERTAQYLGETDNSFADLYEAITKQYGQIDYEQQALQTLINALQKQGKKLLLLIDNVGDVLRKLDTQEEQRLREVLLTIPDIRLVGATSVAIEQVHDYTKPFYEFFKIIHLDGLSQQEAVGLFLKLGETYYADAVRQLIERQPGRIESIRRLTGGVIRTMVLLFEIMVENDSGSVFRNLEILLDRVTPLYKHRMDDLPSQQQKIVATLAQAWDAASTRELAQAVRLESKVVSAQLKQLINSGLVEKIETNTKNHLYRLEERFFNIWYLMRFGRKTDLRVLWLIRFFELMFEGNSEWMHERIERHLESIDKAILEPHVALYLTTVFKRIVKDEEVEDLLSRKTRIYLLNIGQDKLAKEVKYSNYEKVTEMMDKKQFQDAIKLLEDFHKKTHSIYVDLAACYLLSNNSSEAERIILKMIDESESSFRIEVLSNNQNNTNTDSEKAETSTVRVTIGTFGLMNMISYERDQNAQIFPTKEVALGLEIAARYFCNHISSRKGFTKQLIAKLVPIGEEEFYENVPNILTFLYIIDLWDNNFDKMESDPFCPSLFEECCCFKEAGLNLQNLGHSYIKLLLAKKQYHTSYNYFQKEEWQLKDRYKPLYYATLFFLKDEYPTEYLRMGPELKETVDDILAEVAQMAIDYA